VLSSKIVEKPLFWVLVISTLFLLPLVKSLRRPQVEVPPVLGEIENFRLTNQNGTEITWENSFKGTVVIANFIFTTCPDVCPLLTQQMAKIQERILGSGASIKLISVSVDPENDKPAVLKKYAEKYGARSAVWTFLTGDLQAVYDAVVKGFKVSLDSKSYRDLQKSPGDMAYELMGITHGENFVIIDQIGQIRAYKQARNQDEINDIIKTVGIIANQNPKFAPRPRSLDAGHPTRAR
jgi:protein SCO1/2